MESYLHVPSSAALNSKVKRAAEDYANGARDGFENRHGSHILSDGDKVRHRGGSAPSNTHNVTNSSWCEMSSVVRGASSSHPPL